MKKELDPLRQWLFDNFIRRFGPGSSKTTGQWKQLFATDKEFEAVENRIQRSGLVVLYKQAEVMFAEPV